MTTKNIVKNEDVFSNKDIEMLQLMKTKTKLIRPGTTQLRNRFRNTTITYTKFTNKKVERVLSAWNDVTEYGLDPISTARSIKDLKKKIGNLESKRIGFATEELDRR